MEAILNRKKMIKQLMFKDRIKLFAKNEKALMIFMPTIWIYTQEKAMEFGIENMSCSWWEVEAK